MRKPTSTSAMRENRLPSRVARIEEVMQPLDEYEDSDSVYSSASSEYNREAIQRLTEVVASLQRQVQSLTDALNMRNQPSTSVASSSSSTATTTSARAPVARPTPTPVARPATRRLRTASRYMSSQDDDLEENNVFAAYIERLASREYPTIYGAHANDDDYDYRYWTWSLRNSEPIYTKGMDNRRKGVLRSILTELDARGDVSGSLIRSQYKTDRGIYLQNIELKYNPRDAALRAMRDIRPIEQQEQEVQLSTTQLSRAAQAFTSLQGNVLLLDEATPSPSIARVIGSQSYFTGSAVDTVYEIDYDELIARSRLEDSAATFASIILKYLVSFIATSPDSTIYGIRVFYLKDSDQPDERSIPVTFMRPINILRQDAFTIAETMLEAVEAVGSDSSYISEDYYLDYTRFVVRSITLRYAGGAYIQSKNKTYAAATLPWCRIKDYKVSSEGCYFKILHEHLKSVGDEYATKFKNYNAFCKDLTSATRPYRVSMDQAHAWAEHCGVNLVIYDQNGNVLYGTENDSSVSDVSGSSDLSSGSDLNSGSDVSNTSTLRVMLHNDHYVHVIALNIRNEVLGNEPPMRRKVQVFYDIETIFNKDGMLLPYSIAWIVRADSCESIHFRSTPEPSLNLFDSLFNSLAIEENIEFTFIAYNGSGFDHIFLFKYLATRGFPCKIAPSTGNKILNMEFWLSRSRASLLKVWDPYRFLMTSLSNAAKSFGLEQGKLELNHDDVQRAYNNDSLRELLDRNHEGIKNYNIRDVQVLMELCDRFTFAINQVTGIDAFTKPTIASLAESYWKSIIAGKIAVEQGSEDMRAAIVGGRVDSSLLRDGEHEYAGPCIMLDVVSLYPYVMENYNYPIGNYQVVTDRREMIECFKNNKYMGLYPVKYDQSTLHRHACIVPKRNEDGSLDWRPHSGQGLLPCVTIKLLKKYGCRVSPIEGTAYVWKKIGSVFQQYVNSLKCIKEQQDELKSVGDSSYNPAIREAGKLLLNSLSGKVSQKSYNTTTKLVSSRGEYEKLIRSIVSSDDIESMSVEFNERIKDINFLSSNAALFTLFKNSTACKPIHLGVFIYAYARAYMYDLFYFDTSVMYSDTDSAVIRMDDYHRIKDHLPIAQAHKKFGDLEVEAEADRLYVFKPKSYVLFKDNKVLKWRFKGVKKTDRWRIKGESTSHQFNDEGIHALVQAHKDHCRVELITSRLVRKVKDGHLVHKEQINDLL